MRHYTSPCCKPSPSIDIRSPEQFRVSPDAELIAFRIGAIRSSPMLVVDRSGGVIFRSAPSGKEGQEDSPVAWLPGGQALVWRRVSPRHAQRNRTQWFLLSVASGDSEPLVLESRLVPQGISVVNAARFVLRLKDVTGQSASGLYMADRGPGGLELGPILLDQADVRWEGCRWVQETDGVLRLVAEAVRNQDGSGRVHEFWLADVRDGTLVSRRRVADVPGRVSSCDVSPNGQWIAAIVRDPTGPNAVLIISIPDGQEPKQTVSLVDDVQRVTFSPTGNRFIAWAPGWMDPRYSWPPSLFVVDTATARGQRVVLPKVATSVMDVQWLSDDVLVIGVQGLGILRVSWQTGEHSLIWRFPTGG